MMFEGYLLTQEKNDRKKDKGTEKESTTFCMIWFDFSSI